MGKRRTDEEVLAEGRKYSSRKEFSNGCGGAYNSAVKRGLIDQLYPSKHDSRSHWTDDCVVLAEGMKYSSRYEFQRGSFQAYKAALKRGLLDQLYVSKRRRLSDAELLAEGGKYKSQADFRRAKPAMVLAAGRRKLLDIIDFPENYPPSDNDAIYIWRAVCQHYNGNPIYKIGVTSVRFGTQRIERVARKAGFEYELICCEAVQGKATTLEAKLHLLGEDPQFTGFDGCTEFRALSSSALEAALALINLNRLQSASNS